MAVKSCQKAVQQKKEQLIFFCNFGDLKTFSYSIHCLCNYLHFMPVSLLLQNFHRFEMYPILLLLYFPMFSLTTNVKMKVVAILSRDMRKKCCNILYRMNTMRVVCIQEI